MFQAINIGKMYHPANDSFKYSMVVGFAMA